MKKFSIYFDQINATFYDVEAPSASQARDKATRLWRQEMGYPVIGYVEEITDEENKTSVDQNHPA